MSAKRRPKVKPKAGGQNLAAQTKARRASGGQDKIPARPLVRQGRELTDDARADIDVPRTHALRQKAAGKAFSPRERVEVAAPPPCPDSYRNFGARNAAGGFSEANGY
jgi:hypothetical protein